MLAPCAKAHARLLVEEPGEGTQALVQPLRPGQGRRLDAGRFQKCLAQPRKLTVLGDRRKQGHCLRQAYFLQKQLHQGAVAPVFVVERGNVRRSKAYIALLCVVLLAV
ncbi:hypothetical protein ACEF39_001313 [Stenotrophomonas indicatrix]